MNFFSYSVVTFGISSLARSRDTLSIVYPYLDRLDKEYANKPILSVF